MVALGGVLLCSSLLSLKILFKPFYDGVCRFCRRFVGYVERLILKRAEALVGTQIFVISDRSFYPAAIRNTSADRHSVSEILFIYGQNESVYAAEETGVVGRRDHIKIACHCPKDRLAALRNVTGKAFERIYSSSVILFRSSS